MVREVVEEVGVVDRQSVDEEECRTARSKFEAGALLWNGADLVTCQGQALRML